MIGARHLVVALGLAIGPACVVSGSGSVGVEATTPVVVQEPPPPQVEAVTARPGWLWIKGRWNWQGGQWVWAGGHWERERAGYAWTEGRWEARGNQWVWVDGTWAAAPAPVVATTVVETPAPVVEGGISVNATAPTGSVTISASPTAAPPPVRVETVAPRAGFVWITGRWDWRSGQWTWVGGHWEREHANMMWVAGRWEMQGGRWIWVEGTWQAGGPVVRDHRNP